MTVPPARSDDEILSSRFRNFAVLAIFVLLLPLISIQDRSDGSEEYVQNRLEVELGANGSGFQQGSSNHVPYSSNDEIVCIIQEPDSSISCSFLSEIENGKLDSYEVAYADFSEFGKPISISSGVEHSCSLTDRERVICWHNRGDSFVKVQQIDQPVMTISSGDEHACAASFDGKVWCWRFQFEPYFSVEEESFQLIGSQHGVDFGVSSGGSHSCRIDISRSVSCWKSTFSGFSLEFTLNGIGPAYSVVMGEDFACAQILEIGVSCWNWSAGDNHSRPFSVPSSNRSLSISAGGEILCLSNNDLSHKCIELRNENSFTVYEGVLHGISITSSHICYTDSVTLSLGCNSIGGVSKGPTFVGIPVLGPMDSDGDGIVDHLDDAPFDYSVSKYCSPGFFGAHQCTQSSEGSSAPFSRLIGPIPCKPGTFQYKTGEVECFPSPPGTFSSGSGSIYSTSCPAGSFNGAVGSDSYSACIPVPAGNYSNRGDSQPSPCEIGFFQPHSGQPWCLPALPGNFTGSEGSIVQSMCPKGQFQSTAKSSFCLFASPGHFVDSPGSADQTECPAGTYNPDQGSESPDSCLDAAPGHYVNVSGSATQAECEVGSYQPSFGNEGCLPCPAGYFSPNPGSVAVSDCSDSAPGFFLDGILEQCPVGTYQPLAGQDSCLEAAPGHYVDSPGSADQTECPTGYYSSNSGSSSEYFCGDSAPGHYMAWGLSEECVIGTYQPRSGEGGCLDAAPGHYVNVSGSATQAECEVGSYQPSFGNEGCLPCPAGYFSPNPGSVAVSDCSDSAPGFFLDGILEQCPVGTYQPLAGQDSCLEAAPGHYVDSPGSADQTECPAGTYNPDQGSESPDSCLDAAPGHYVDGSGASVQVPCPVGTYNPNSRTSGVLSCSKSQPGHYSEGFAPTSFLPCSVGTFQPLAGQDSCLEAAPGHYVDSPGSADQTECPAGTYNPDQGSESPDSCLDAAPGHYVDGSGASVQVPCPVGTYNPNSRSYACIIAEAGNFAPNEASTSVKSCQRGAYQPESGESNCLIPPLGHFVDTEGAVNYKKCLPGTFRNSSQLESGGECAITPPGFYSGNGQIDPTPCPEGHYNPDSGVSSIEGCLITPSGTYAPMGSPVPILCPPGYFQANDGEFECLPAPKDSIVTEFGASDYQMCLGGGTTLSEGSASSFDCHYDIDGDGVEDRYDSLAHFSGSSLDGFVRGNIIFYFIFTIGVTLLRRENIG